MMPRNAENSVTLSGEPADPLYDGPAPKPIDPDTGMHGDYWVLSQEERAKGFVRSVRVKYRHDACGTKTMMAYAIAETYARDPAYYGRTFCAHCGGHFPVGAGGEFTWVGTDEKVGA